MRHVATSEDTILFKLDWYRQGGGISDQKWRDIPGILKVQGNSLEFTDLRKWSQKLNLTNLLDEALSDAGPQEDS
jgi:hypothetical protein